MRGGIREMKMIDYHFRRWLAGESDYRNAVKEYRRENGKEDEGMNEIC